MIVPLFFNFLGLFSVLRGFFFLLSCVAAFTVKFKAAERPRAEQQLHLTQYTCYL